MKEMKGGWVDGWVVAFLIRLERWRWEYLDTSVMMMDGWVGRWMDV